VIKISEQTKTENVQPKTQEITPKQPAEKLEVKNEKEETKKKKRGRPRKTEEPEKLHVKAERLGKKKTVKEENGISVKDVAIAAIIVMILAALLYYVSFHGKKGDNK